MKTALSMWSVHQYWYDQSWRTVDFIEFAATTGVDGVELLNCFWRNRDHEIPEIQKSLEENKIPVACFCACNNLATTNEVIWQEQLNDIFESVDLAVLFGAKVVRVFSGDKDEDSTFEQAYTQIIRGLQEAAQYAQNQGITLCLENHGLFAGKAQQVLDVISAVNSPALQSTFDTGNFLLVGEDPSEAIQLLKNSVSHVHFKDFQIVADDYDGQTYASLSGEKFAGKICGEGQVDLRFILQQLKDTAYTGWLTVEFEGEEEPKYGSIQSVKRLQELLREI